MNCMISEDEVVWHIDGEVLARQEVPNILIDKISDGSVLEFSKQGASANRLLVRMEDSLDNNMVGGEPGDLHLVVQELNY